MDLPLSHKNINSVLYKRSDSLKLRVKLFPEILKYTTVQEYKSPVYALLAKLKDSSLIKIKNYKRFKEQIINDGKVEIKRSLNKSANQSYISTRKNSTLEDYVKLIFPFRKEKNAIDFYSKLLKSDNYEALTMYYTLLKKNKEAIPIKLTEKTIDNFKCQWLLIDKLEENDLLTTDIKAKVNQDMYAKSKLFYPVRYKKTDSIENLATEKIKTDTGKDITLYFYKLKIKNSYGNSERLYYIAFENNPDKKINTESYMKSNRSGIYLSFSKTEEEQIEETILKAKHKTRKRIYRKY